MINTPYVKEYKKGVLTNPIEKQYLHQGLNRSLRRDDKKRLFSNKKGLQLVVVNLGKGKFYKAKRVLTHLKGKTLVNYVE